MKNNLYIVTLLFLIACSQQKNGNIRESGPVNNFTTEGKAVSVFCTADSTELRLSPTDTLQFRKSDPIAESRIYVFADPDKTYQAFIGIGGALTDASAETFAKLPEDRQEELGLARNMESR